jgi:hypothetical protein
VSDQAQDDLIFWQYLFGTLGLGALCCVNGEMAAGVEWWGGDSCLIQNVHDGILVLVTTRSEPLSIRANRIFRLVALKWSVGGGGIPLQPTDRNFRSRPDNLDFCTEEFL